MQRSVALAWEVRLGVLRFGVFELDPAVPELRRGGRRVHLQDMPLRVLQLLLEHPGELVVRETFFERLWPDDELGILDDNLNTAIRKLRLALDDSAHHPRFIETVPKRGYRFVAALQEEVDARAAQSDTSRAAESPSKETAPELAAPDEHAPAATRRGPLVAAAVIVIVIIAAVLWTVRMLGGSGDTASTVDGTSPGTLVVLPFVSAGNRPEDEYFGDGLAEELMDRLSHADGLRVVSRTSARALRGKDLGAREIGELLGATSLVEGSVRRDGDHLRISVRLINARDGYQLWSEVYDRRMHDVLRVQEEIALSIAHALATRLHGPTRNDAGRVPPADPLAYDAYLKGRFYWHRRTEASLRASATYFQEAVQRSPDYAPAWAGLADAYAVLGFYDYLPPGEAFPQAQSAARRALELDSGNASAHGTLGYAALYHDWDLIEAEARFRESIARDPNLSKTHQWYANLLTAAGRFDEAEREMRRAQQLEPLSLIASAALGWTLYYAGRHEEALAQYRLTLDLDPDFELAYLWSGWALEALGRHDEARGMLEEAVTRSGGSGISVAALARLRALSGDRETARRELETLQQSSAYVPAYEIAKAWFALGSDAQGMQWLERALEQRSHSMVFLRVDPQLARQREAAAFRSLLERVHPRQ